MPEPLADAQIGEICNRWGLDPDTSPTQEAHQHVRDLYALLMELARMQDCLADCWLLIDRIADELPGIILTCRSLTLLGLGNDLTEIVRSSETLLREQQAPGWKEGETP